MHTYFYLTLFSDFYNLWPISNKFSYSSQVQGTCPPLPLSFLDLKLDLSTASLVVLSKWGPLLLSCPTYYKAECCWYFSSSFTSFFWHTWHISSSPSYTFFPPFNSTNFQVISSRSSGILKPVLLSASQQNASSYPVKYLIHLLIPQPHTLLICSIIMPSPSLEFCHLSPRTLSSPGISLSLSKPLILPILTQKSDSCITFSRNSLFQKFKHGKTVYIDRKSMVD